MSDLQSFADLGLSEQTLQALKEKGFEEPTKIQAACIPLLLKNKVDVIGQAQTGTGKTAAFGLPILEIVDPSHQDVQALILAPTRELAVQDAEEINSLKGDRHLRWRPSTAAPRWGFSSGCFSVAYRSSSVPRDVFWTIFAVGHSVWTT